MNMRSLFSGKKSGDKDKKKGGTGSTSGTSTSSHSSGSSKGRGGSGGKGNKKNQPKWEDVLKDDIQPVNEETTAHKSGAINNVYIREDKELGQGAFSKVFEATHRLTKKKYAIKCVSKQAAQEQDVEAVRKEIDFLTHIKHPNIIRLYEVYENTSEIFLVLELMEGGELFDRIVAKRCFSEEEARRALCMIASAVQHLHSHSIVHRDLKPENILYKSPNDDHLVLSDFGLSVDVPDGRSLTQPCGTLQYAAPEVLTARTYQKAVDMWGIGVIAYALLCGFPPFYTNTGDEQELANKIADAAFEFPSPWWDRVSNSAKDMISGLLEKDPTKRLTAEQMLEHEWMVNPATEVAYHDTEHVGFPFHQNRNSEIFIQIINKTIEYRRQLEAEELEELKQKAWYTV
jgi:calcium/calmodulin-dependent protein kinase I